MANKKNNKGNSNNKNSKTTNTKSKKTSGINKNELNKKNIQVVKQDNEKRNTFVMKLLVFLGVLIFGFVLVYLMYHFFVEKSDIKINMSTDKQMEYITINGKEELIMTQKFVSDLAYNMRYDINSFKVFKYKNQDIYKNLDDERILVVVEKSILPTNCANATLDTEYNNCYVKVDDYTEYHYFSTNTKVYKITIKTPGVNEYNSDVDTKINYMLKTFVMSD